MTEFQMAVPTGERHPNPELPVTESTNLLRNPSFEEGHHHPNNIPELQIKFSSRKGGRETQTCHQNQR